MLMPLELLCLRAAVSRLSLTRRPVKGIQDVFEQAKIVVKGSSIKGNQMYDRWRSYQEELSQAGGQHKNLHNLFRRHVKPKKQHEIARMASLCSAVCLASGVGLVVDVGSGVGHLSRQVFNISRVFFRRLRKNSRRTKLKLKESGSKTQGFFSLKTQEIGNFKVNCRQNL